MGGIVKSFTAVIVEAVLAIMRTVFKKDIVADSVDDIQRLRTVLVECVDLLDVSIQAALPDQDGVSRLTDEEIGQILDEADDIPAAIAALTGGGGDA